MERQKIPPGALNLFPKSHKKDEPFLLWFPPDDFVIMTKPGKDLNPNEGNFGRLVPRHLLEFVLFTVLSVSSISFLR
jgi:hypothetical protein